jgi:hypothetical protein
LANTPFFISGLAYGDVFQAEPDATNGHIFEFTVLEHSGHSVVWVLNNSGIDISECLEEAKALGCKVEGFEQFSLYSLDVPPEIDLSAFDRLIDQYDRKGIAFAFPAWSHGN